MTRVDKPALLRRLLHLGCEYSGRVLAYQKMVGRLQDAGNTTTLASYLDLLEGAGFLCGLQKCSGQKVRQRGSSPKLLVLNTALMTAQSGRSFDEARADPEYWGRLTESAVGAHLVNSSRGTSWKVGYWIERHNEVDFVLQRGRSLVAIEVKSGGARTRLSGLTAFREAYRGARTLVVGSGGVPIEDLLTSSLDDLLHVAMTGQET